MTDMTDRPDPFDVELARSLRVACPELVKAALAVEMPRPLLLRDRPDPDADARFRHALATVTTTCALILQTIERATRSRLATDAPLTEWTAMWVIGATFDDSEGDSEPGEPDIYVREDRLGQLAGDVYDAAYGVTVKDRRRMLLPAEILSTARFVVEALHEISHGQVDDLVMTLVRHDF